MATSRTPTLHVVITFFNQNLLLFLIYPFQRSAVFSMTSEAYCSMYCLYTIPSFAKLNFLNIILYFNSCFVYMQVFFVHYIHTATNCRSAEQHEPDCSMQRHSTLCMFMIKTYSNVTHSKHCSIVPMANNSAALVLCVPFWSEYRNLCHLKTCHTHMICEMESVFYTVILHVKGNMIAAKIMLIDSNVPQSWFGWMADSTKFTEAFA